MAPQGQISAGPCGLGSDCQAPEKTHQAHYKCCHCNCGLHGMFCSTVTENKDAGSIMVKCLQGFGCKVSMEVEQSKSGGNDNDISVLSAPTHCSVAASALTMDSLTSIALSSTATAISMKKSASKHRNTGGWKPSLVINYIDISTAANGILIQTCKQCGHQKLSKTIQSSRWAVHLVCGDCPQIPLEVHLAIGKESKQDEIVATMKNLED